LYRNETINGISVTRAPIYVPDKPTGTKRLLHHASFALTSLWPVLSSATRWRPDVVFSVAPSLMSAAFSAWIARRIGALSWLHLQDFEIDAAFDLGLLANKRLRAPMVAVERKILRSFDYVSTISPQMMERLAAKGVDEERTKEVRNWTDIHKIASGKMNPHFRKDQLDLDKRHFVCLYSGTMSNKQGLDLIVDAARALDNPDSNIRFVLCGEGPHKTWLERLASGLTNVQFLGLQHGESFAELLHAADVHLIPQKAEAADLVLPSKLGGILASGKPVIVMARQGTGLAEEVEKAGIVVAPGNTERLTAAICALANDPALCTSFGEVARRTAILKWDRATILRELEQLLLTCHNGTKTVSRRPSLDSAVAATAVDAIALREHRRNSNRAS
jgi:colanic acid biosynthesis glycosyl transferase WcaI